MPSTLRRVLLGFAAVLGLSLTSCFEPPIREELLLRFLPNGAVVATSTVRINDPAEGNLAVKRRIADARRALLEESDPWSARFAASDPAAERFTWEKRLGDLRSASRSAVIAEPRGLEAFFGDTSLGVRYAVDPETGTAELSIVPGASARASRKQRQDTEKTLEAWTAAVSGHLQAAGALYAFLEDHPERARPCFAALFSDESAEEGGEARKALTAEEARLVERASQAMEPVLEVLNVPKDGAYSPDEVSHLVYDPFPARLTLKLPGAPLASEGFQPGPEGSLTVAGLGLWDSLHALEGRWIAPDPVLFYVEALRKDKPEVDLDAFLRRTRRTATAHLIPSADEVKAAIEERLKPASLYRVSWKIQPNDEEEFQWSEEEKAP
ncbi:MAG: hypothetical protein ACJ75H_01570 [Thermoanaerobaculia bacterium]